MLRLFVELLFYHLQQAGTRVFCAECLLYVGVISTGAATQDDLVIFVKKTFIRLVHHVDEMIEMIKLLLPRR